MKKKYTTPLLNAVLFHDGILSSDSAYVSGANTNVDIIKLKMQEASYKIEQVRNIMDFNL